MSLETLREFMRELAASARTSGNVYFTDGATAFYPAIDAEQFRNKVHDFLRKAHDRE